MADSLAASSLEATFFNAEYSFDSKFTTACLLTARQVTAVPERVNLIAETQASALQMQWVVFQRRSRVDG